MIAGADGLNLSPTPSSKGKNPLPKTTPCPLFRETYLEIQGSFDLFPINADLNRSNDLGPSPYQSPHTFGWLKNFISEKLTSPGESQVYEIEKKISTALTFIDLK